MYRFLISITVVLVLLLQGCSSKKKVNGFTKKVNVIQAQKEENQGKGSLTWCNQNITQNGNSYTFKNMSESELDKCLVLIDKAKMSEKSKAVTDLDLSRFGVKSVYTVDEARDIALIKKAHKWLFSKQKYILDSEKFNGISDVHENLYPYIKLLEDNYHLVEDYEGFKAVYRAKGYSDVHFIFKDGKWFVQGDCESTYITYETYLIKKGMNPQRIFEVFTDVCTDAALTTAAGGHMFGFVILPSGKNLTIEQLPYPRTMGELITKRFYRMKEFRRADHAIRNFKKFPLQMLEDFKANKLVKLNTTNEVK